MNIEDLINKVEEWNTNLKKHSPNIPYTQVDEDARAMIIGKLRNWRWLNNSHEAEVDFSREIHASLDIVLKIIKELHEMTTVYRKA